MTILERSIGSQAKQYSVHQVEAKKLIGNFQKAVDTALGDSFHDEDFCFVEGVFRCLLMKNPR